MAPKGKEGYRSTRAPPGISPSTQATPGTPPDSPDMPPLVPSNSPALHHPSAPLTVEDLGQLLLKLIEVNKSPDSTKPAEPGKPDDSEQAKAKVVRASGPEFKAVGEVCGGKGHAYKIVESVEPAKGSDKLDEYEFIVRMRIDKKTGDPTFFIDIKSMAEKSKIL